MKLLLPAALLAVFLILLAGCSSGSQAPTPPALQATPPADMQVIEGKLLNQITRLEKDMPRADTEGFIVPTDEQKQTFIRLVTDLHHGRLEEALLAASGSQYELIWYTDRNDNDAVDFVLREVDPSRQGWGLFVFRAATNSPLIIEAPHPIFDQGTPALAADLFRALDARALLVAGADRDANRDGSADASANGQTIFQAIHQAELEQSLQSTGAGIVLQIHGFSAGKHPAYPQVIIGYQAGSDASPLESIEARQLANKIVDSLNARHITTGICGGDQWRDLCGSTNIQATTLLHGIFLHLELDETVRDDDRKFIDALVEALKE